MKIFYAGLPLLLLSLALQAQSEPQTTLKMNADYVVSFSEQPDFTAYTVDISALDLSNKAAVTERLNRANTRLSEYADLDFTRRTATLKIKNEVPLPDNWNLESWNAYFSELGRFMNQYTPKSDN